MKTKNGFLVLLIFCILFILEGRAYSVWNQPNSHSFPVYQRRTYVPVRVFTIRTSFKESHVSRLPLKPEESPNTQVDIKTNNEKNEFADEKDINQDGDVGEPELKTEDVIETEEFSTPLNDFRQVDNENNSQKETSISQGINHNPMVPQFTDPRYKTVKRLNESTVTYLEPEDIDPNNTSQPDTRSDKRMKVFTAIPKIEVTEIAFQEPQTKKPEVENLPLREVVPEVVNNLSNIISKSLSGTGNYIYAPFSISMALAMTYLGARGSTAREMEEALGYTHLLGTKNTHLIHGLFHDTLSNITAYKKKSETMVSSGIFVQKQYEILPNFTNEIKTYYWADIKNVDFAHDGDKAVEVINNWTSNNTNGKIPKMFEEPPEPLTRMVLVNAIYFKGFWKHQFNPNFTTPSVFYKADGTTTEVTFMTISNEMFQYYQSETLGYTFLRLQYTSRTSMIIALPLRKEVFPRLEFSNEIMSKIRYNFHRVKVIVKIPKFKMSYEKELTDILKTIKITELFSQNSANLTGISKRNDLYVSTVLHRAIIEVNEQGTEAAGVTGVNFVARSKYGQPKTFIANHPFQFIIIHNPTGTIVFTGRVADP